MTADAARASSPIGRRGVVKALAGGAVVAAGVGLPGGPAWAAAGSADLDVRTLNFSDLSFSTAATPVLYSLVSPNLRQLDDDFRGHTGRRYQRLHPGGPTAAAELTFGGGTLRADGSAPYYTILRSGTAQRAPYSGVIVDVREMSGGGGQHDTVLAGLARDADNHLMGWYNHATGSVGIDVSVDGTVTTVGTAEAKLTAPFRLAMTLTGTGANVLADEGDGWHRLTEAMVSELLDLRGVGASIANTTFDVAPEVPRNGTLGQSFTAKEPFVSAGGMFPTNRTTGTEVTLSLYREGPGGELITRSRITDIPDNAWQFLTVDTPLPPGTYYLEQSEPSGPVSWWTSSKDEIDWGTAYENGEPVAGDRTIRVLSAPTATGAELLAAYRNSFGVRADSGTIVLGRVEAGYFGQAGIRDPTIVTRPDGSPYIKDGKLYLTLSNGGLAGGIPAAHLGVFRMSLRDYSQIEEIGKIFFDRDDQVHGDHAAHLVHDPATGGFRVFAVTFGDYDVYNMASTEYATSSGDVLHGVSVLTPRPLARGLDPYAVRVDGDWWLALSDGGTTTTYRYTDQAFEKPVLAGENDNGGEYYEGTKLCRIGRKWRITTSSTTDYRVYDLHTKLLGTLDAPHPSGWIPHAMVLPVPLPGQRTRYLQLSMDNDGDPVTGAFGHFRIHTSDQTARGREFPLRRASPKE